MHQKVLRLQNHLFSHTVWTGSIKDWSLLWLVRQPSLSWLV